MLHFNSFYSKRELSSAHEVCWYQKGSLSNTGELHIYLENSIIKREFALNCKKPEKELQYTYF